MSTTATPDAPLHELATRASGGLEITLYWDEADDTTSIDLHHATTDVTFRFRVPSGRALDAFHHPFVYLASQIHPPSRTLE